VKINHIGPGLVEVSTDSLSPLSSADSFIKARAIANAASLRDLSVRDAPVSEPFQDVAGLRSNRLLGCLSDKELKELIAVGRWLAFEKCESLSNQTRSVNEILFILAGRAKAEITAARNPNFRVTVDFLGPGDDVGLLSLVDGASHSATVDAMEKVYAIAVPYSYMRMSLDRHPEWYRALAEIAVTRLRSNGNWLQALI